MEKLGSCKERNVGNSILRGQTSKKFKEPIKFRLKKRVGS
jgi:hypothetical protein